MISYICKAIGCQVTLPTRGYCVEHKHLDVPYNYKRNIRTTDHHHIYLTARWKKLRKRIIERDGGVCVKCGSDYRLQVDHIIPHNGSEELMWDEFNLQTLCAKCHGIKCHKESVSKRR